MNERLREWLTAAGTRLRALNWRGMWQPALLTVAALLLGLWFAMPVDALLLRLSRGEAMQDSAWRFEIDDARMGLFGPVLYGPALSGPTRLRVDRIALHPRLATLWFQPGMSFDVDDDAGDIHGNAGMDGDLRDLRLHLEQVDLAGLGLGELPLGIRARGTLGGDLDLAAPARSPYRVTGTANLSVDDVVLWLPEGLMPVSDVIIPHMDLEMIAKDGMLDIDAIRIDGEDISGTIRGSIRLSGNLPSSRAQLEFRLRLGDRLADGLAPLLPMAGFRQERDIWVRTFNGQLATLFGG